MPEKRPTHIRIQNWKKTIAGAIVVLLQLSAIAQNSSFQEYNFFDNRNGLASHITRKTRVDAKGSAWIATDAGVTILPENQTLYKSLIQRVGSVPVWDIYFHRNLIYVGTHDSQILVFNQTTGKFARKIIFERFRRFREINGLLFAVGSNGIAEISKPKPTWWFKTENTPAKTTALDIAYWQNTYFVFQYGHTAIYTSIDGRKWDKDESLISREIKKTQLVALSAITVKNKLYIGLESNEYMIFHDWNTCDSVVFAQRPDKSYAIWDIDADHDKVYFALGNHVNFDQGSVLVQRVQDHNSISSPEMTPFPFVWGITVDTINNGLWLNSVVAGTSFVPDLGRRIRTPIEFQGFLSQNKVIVGWKNNEIYIQKKQKWSKYVLPIYVKKCFYASDGSIWIHAEKGIYRIFNSKLSLISPKHFQFSELVGDYLYVCEYFHHVDAIDINTLKIISNIHPKLTSIITIKPLNQQLLAQTESNGYFLINQLDVKSVTLDRKIPKAKNNFYFSGNFLISENGKELVFYKFSKKESNFTSIYKINLSTFFPNQKIDWIQTNIHGIWVFTNNTVIQLAFKDVKHGLQIIGQFYLGKRAQNASRVFLSSESVSLISGISIDQIPLTPKNQCSYDGKIDLDMKNYRFFLYSIAGRVWQGSNFHLSLTTSKFIQYHDGYIQMVLIDENKNLIKQCIYPNQVPIWFNDLKSGVYQVKLFNGDFQKSVVFRVNKPLFLTPAFWLLLILGVGLLIFVLVYNQKERFKLTEKLLSMEIATLKNNMNPHFIFNTMNLIQSLIVRTKVKQALKATSELAKLNRLFLETSNKDFIQLTDEIEYAKKYVGLEQMRFEDDQYFQFHIFQDENIQPDKWFVPPLILQPLLENSIKHGALMSQHSSSIALNLDLAAPNLLIISVKNEINNKRKPRPGTQIGLKLVKERLNLLNRKYPNLFAFELNIETTTTHFNVAISIKRLDQNWIYE